MSTTLAQQIARRHQENDDLKKRLKERVERATLIENSLWDRRAETQGYLANLSHELRTPLHMITGYSELLLLVSPDPRLVADIRSILKAGRQLSVLVDHALQIIVLDACNVNLHLGSVPLGGLLEQASHRVQALRPGCHIEVHAPVAHVFMDEERVQQFLAALLGTAIDSGPDDSRVSIYAEAHASNWDFRVVQPALRVLDKDLQGLLQPFHPLPGRDLTRTSGLGLPLAARLAKILGGSVHVESSQEGTVFVGRLPRIEP